MRNISQALIFIGLLLGTFALVGFYSYGKNGEFLGLDIDALVIDFGLGLFMLGSGLAMKLCLFAMDRVLEKNAEREAAAADGNPLQEDIPLCPSCLTPAELNQHFCMKCWTPLTSHAEIDPLGQIYSMGDMYWKLTRGPSKPIAMVGLVLLVGPAVLTLLIGSVAFLVALFSGNLNRFIPGLFGLGGSIEGVIVLLTVLIFVAFQLPYALVFIKAIRNRHSQVPRELPCVEYEEGEKEIESVPEDSGDRKHPPSDLTSLRETRGDV